MSASRALSVLFAVLLPGALVALIWAGWKAGATLAAIALAVGMCAAILAPDAEPEPRTPFDPYDTSSED